MGMTVYFASPLGFATSTKAFMDEMEQALVDAGIAVLNPWKGDFGTDFARAHAMTDGDARRGALHRINTAIGEANARLIRACDGVVAVLDGVDVDSGTASEIGFAFALGKRIHGLRTDSRLIGDNEGTVVNLQVQYFIEASGGQVVRDLGALIGILKEITP